MIVRPDIALNKKRTRARDGFVVEPCAIKRRYRSRKLAAQDASRITRQTGELTEHYHCPVHHCWHVGRP